MKLFSIKPINVFYAPDDAVLAEEEDPGVPPKTREENFWAMIAGDTNAVDMEPKTRIEYYMKKAAQRIGALESSEEENT